MARMLQENERLVLIGSTALRTPSGEPLPSVPMYIIEKVGEGDTEPGISASEELLHRDISGLLVEKFRQYMEGVEALGGI